MRPGRALQWLLLAIVVGNIGRLPVLSSAGRDTSIVLNDLCVGALAALGLIVCLVRRSVRVDAVIGFGLIFATIGFCSAVAAVPRFGLNPLEFLLSTAYLVRWMTYFGVYVFILNHVSLEQVEDVWQAMEKALLFMAAFGILQSLFFPHFAQIVYAGPKDTVGWDDQGSRLVSTILEPNIMSAMLVAVMLPMFARMSLGVRVSAWKPLLLLVALALTLSRSGLLALFVGLGVIVLIRGVSIRLLRFFGTISLVILLALPKLIAFAREYSRFDVGADTSAGARVVAWILALGTIYDHPVFGVGFNTYGYYKQHMGVEVLTTSDYGSDGGLLFAAVMTGLVGLLFYVGMLLMIGRNSRRAWRDVTLSPEHRGLAIGGAAGLAAIVIHSFFANSLFTTFVMEILWVLAGLIAVVARKAMSGQASTTAL